MVSASTETVITSFYKTRRFMVLDHEELYEYDLTFEEFGDGEKIFTLYNSNGEQWDSLKGDFLLSMTDDGNSVRFSRNKKHLQYSEATYLRLLLNFSQAMEENKVEKAKYLVIEKTNIIEL